MYIFSPSGGLSLAVEGPSKAEITCKDNKDGTCTVSYLPTTPGDYNIIVKFDNKHISGSPFTAKITGEEINTVFILLMYIYSGHVPYKWLFKAWQMFKPLLSVKGMTPSPGRPSWTWAHRLTCPWRSQRLIWALWLPVSELHQATRSPACSRDCPTDTSVRHSFE